ncbi:hypothetical protein [Alloactinosynnema sp. L-07]|nr:hypothetical protein [Alloactinosynnema sp. L-07]
MTVRLRHRGGLVGACAGGVALARSAMTAGSTTGFPKPGLDTAV